MEKDEIAHFEQFHLCPQCFPKVFLFIVLKWAYMEKGVTSLPNDNFLDLTMFKAFCRQQLDVAKVTISAFDRLENIVGKVENAGNWHYFLFPQCF